MCWVWRNSATSQRSREGIEPWPQPHDLKAGQLAQEAVDAAVNAIAAKIETLIRMVNAKPVYTIHEILGGTGNQPQKVIVIGGPASVFKDLLQPGWAWR